MRRCIHPQHAPWSALTDPQPSSLSASVRQRKVSVRPEPAWVVEVSDMVELGGAGLRHGAGGLPRPYNLSASPFPPRDRPPSLEARCVFSTPQPEQPKHQSPSEHHAADVENASRDGEDGAEGTLSRSAAA